MKVATEIDVTRKNGIFEPFRPRRRRSQVTIPRDRSKEDSRTSEEIQSEEKGRREQLSSGRRQEETQRIKTTDRKNTPSPPILGLTPTSKREFTSKGDVKGKGEEFGRGDQRKKVHSRSRVNTTSQPDAHRSKLSGAVYFDATKRNLTIGGWRGFLWSEATAGFTSSYTGQLRLN